jgi:glycosyltransferase involved in cell wall biosynthesis
MGEDVRPGVNGFVVDVSSPEGLMAALREIDADPQRFLEFARRAAAVALRRRAGGARCWRSIAGCWQGRPRPPTD